MKLSDLAASDYAKVLVYGDSGTGKTCFAAGFPGPIEYWDFDHKISSAAQHYKNDIARLDAIDVHQFASLPVETRMVEFQKRTLMIDQLKRKKQALPFKTLVLDSLTTFSHYMLEDYIHRSQKGLNRALAGINCMQDYQLLDKHLTQIITSLLSLDANVVMIGHMSIDKDEQTGAIVRGPLMAGKFASKLPIFFEEVYVSKVNKDGQYMLQTQTDPVYKCRSQRKLAKEIVAKYESLAGK